MASATPEPALETARRLANAGAPIFVAKPDPNEPTGFKLPVGWQHTTADPAVVDTWEPGDALALVTGVVVDAADNDPRHGPGWASMNGSRPTTYGEAATPSGGTHHLLAPLGVASKSVRDLPGLDIRAGRPDGSGRGFIFIAPTVRTSKATGEPVAYRWTVEPDLSPLLTLAELGAPDQSGAVLAELVGRGRDDVEREPWDPDTLVTPEHRQECQRVLRLAREQLAESQARNEDVNKWLYILYGFAKAGGIDRNLVDQAVWKAVQRAPGDHPYQQVEFNATRRSAWSAAQPALPDVDSWAEEILELAAADEAEATPRAASTTARVSSKHALMHRQQARMAYVVADQYVDKFLHVRGVGWHRWTGRQWAECQRGEETQAVLSLLREQRILAAQTKDKTLKADVDACQSTAAVAAVVSLASKLPGMAATAEEMDADPWLLNTASGTIDLRTGAMRPASPADRITKMTRASWVPGARSKLWEGFLERVMPDPETRAFLQRYVGMALIGIPLEHRLTILTGEGRNGKGVFYGQVSWALGDYAAEAEPELMMAKVGGNAHPTGFMDLRGRRWVVTSETDRGRKLAESTVKRLTGGDRIKARRMREDFIEFDPSHTLTLITNHLPQVSGDDAALWARLLVVPFDVVIPENEQDKNLKFRMQEEKHTNAVLAWALDGLAKYHEVGLWPPASVTGATDAYRQDSDSLSTWLAEECEVGRRFQVESGELWSSWLMWSDRDPSALRLSRNGFTGELRRRGFHTHTGAKGSRLIRGLKLRG